MDIIFDAFGLYILGLVLLFSSYDILLRLIHARKRLRLGLILSMIFLLVMGTILFILSILFLARLYPGPSFIFGVIIFLGTGAGTFQVMKWKRQIASENRTKNKAGNRTADRTENRRSTDKIAPGDRRE